MTPKTDTSAESGATKTCVSAATVVQTDMHAARVSGVTPRPHHTEAAAHAGLNVAAAERRHFAQLPWDLDGLVEQQAEVALVRQAPGTRHLPEQVCNQQNDRQHSSYQYTAAIYTASSACMCLYEKLLFIQQFM